VTPSLARLLMIPLDYYLWDGWKVALDWKESTGNGQGQRIIDDAPQSARDDAEADVMCMPPS